VCAATSASGSDAGPFAALRRRSGCSGQRQPGPVASCWRRRCCQQREAVAALSTPEGGPGSPGAARGWPVWRFLGVPSPAAGPSRLRRRAAEPSHPVAGPWRQADRRDGPQALALPCRHQAGAVGCQACSWGIPFLQYCTANEIGPRFNTEQARRKATPRQRNRTTC
jgi:hypothetical protein